MKKIIEKYISEKLKNFQVQNLFNFFLAKFIKINFLKIPKWTINLFLYFGKFFKLDFHKIWVKIFIFWKKKIFLKIKFKKKLNWKKMLKFTSISRI